MGGAGWEWDTPWEVELSPYVDKEGWAYAPDWAAMDWPPQNGAQVCATWPLPTCTLAVSNTSECQDVKHAPSELCDQLSGFCAQDFARLVQAG